MEMRSEPTEGLDSESQTAENSVGGGDEHGSVLVASNGVGDASDEEVFETAPDRLPIDNNNDENDVGKDENLISESKEMVLEEKSSEVASDFTEAGKTVNVSNEVGEVGGENVITEGDGVAEQLHVNLVDSNEVVNAVCEKEENKSSEIPDLTVENVDKQNPNNGVAKPIDGVVEAEQITEATAVDSNGAKIDDAGVSSDEGSIVRSEEFVDVGDGDMRAKEMLDGSIEDDIVEIKTDDGANDIDTSVTLSHDGLNAVTDSQVDADGGKSPGVVVLDKTDTPLTLLQEEDDDDEDDDDIEIINADLDGEGIKFENADIAKKFFEELKQGSGIVAESAVDDLGRIDGQVVTDSEDEEEGDTDDEGETKELFDSAALAALLKSATGSGSDGDTISVTSQDGSRLFSIERPAGLGSTLRSFKPATRPTRPNLFNSLTASGGGAQPDNNISDEEKKKLENLQQLRVKFLRLIQRLGHSSEEATISQVLYRLALIAGRQTTPIFNLDAAKAAALELEETKADMDFSLNILVLGKTGVGKSATINSILGQQKSQIHAYEPATSSVKEITGVVDGVKIRVIDCPGLKMSGAEQTVNRKILSSVKKLTKKCPPDIVLYVDRLDTQTRDLNDMPFLRTITDAFGSSIWRSAIVALTHAASAPPDGPSGTPMSYEVFVAQRSHVVQQLIGQACGDLRLMNPTLMNPVALVENHPSCRKNREGQKVLPNGQTWRSQLLLLCYSVKVLSEASSLTKPQDPFDHKKLFGFRVRSPPLPYLLSWLLQSRTHPKNAAEQGDVDSDVDLGDISESDDEADDDEYDQLPPFKPLRRKQLDKLTSEQKKAYFDEYDYRVKLLQKKQWSEELKRMRDLKKKGKVSSEDNGFGADDTDPAPAAVPVPLPDMVLPPSFDSDNPGYRYRFLEPNSQFLARPVLDSHGWDHDCGYDGVNVEHGLSVIDRFPASIAVQVTKDKKEFNLHLDSSVSAKHGDNVSSMAGFDIQNVGKQLAYIVRGETKIKNLKRNKTGAGVSVTFLGKSVATGVKVEDQISLGKRWTLIGSTGTVRSKGDSAYGANLEVRLKDRDFPIVQDHSSLGLSLVKWRGDLALGANLQSQLSLGRSSKVAIRAGLNNKMSGQITVKTSSSEQLQIALLGLLPVIMSIYKTIRPGSAIGDTYQIY